MGGRLRGNLSKNSGPATNTDTARADDSGN